MTWALELVQRQKVLLGIVENGDVAAPEDVAERLVLLRGDSLHGLSRPETDGGHLDPRLLFKTLADHVEQLRRIRGVQDHLRRPPPGRNQHQADDAQHRIPPKTPLHKLTSRKRPMGSIASVPGDPHDPGLL